MEDSNTLVENETSMNSTSMSSTAEEVQTNIKDLGPEEVGSFLDSNADYLASYLASRLEDNSEFLANIKLPQQNQGSTVSLLANRQIDVLRERKANSDAKLIEFVSNASENDRLLSQTHQYVVAIMRSDSRATLLDTISHQFTQYFDVEFCTAEIIAADNSENKKIDFLNKSGKDGLFCGSIRPQESQDLFFDEDAQSAVALSRKLNDDQHLFIAVGNSDADFYFSGIGTEFIDFLVDAAAEMLNNIN